MLFDSHAHFSDEAYDDCRGLLADEIRSSGLRFLVDAGSDIRTSEKCADSAEKYPFCYAAVGIHPSETDKVAVSADEAVERLRQLFVANPKVVAIGEIGLDYHYDDGPDRELQKEWLRRQLALAVELGAPVVIHEREAYKDCFDIIKESGAFGRIGVYFHCFSGSADSARELTALGAMIGVCGPVTFKNNKKTPEVVRQTDLKYLLSETDCPYLSPVPMRGKLNKPVYVEYTVRKIAEIKDISYEKAAQATFDNACRFFGIDCAPL